jgi:hypothetical protein
MSLELSKSERKRVGHCLENLCHHLLKWAWRPDIRSSNWRSTIKEQRSQIAIVLEDRPSLRGFAASSLTRAYQRARPWAEGDTGLCLPADCPWTFKQVVSEDFWPDRTA